MSDNASQPQKQPVLVQMMHLPGNFWTACFMEILERLAFFGSRAVAPLFLVASAGDNGLGLNYKDKGLIYMVWALLQCLIPMVSGGYTDRYGYRKSLAVAFVLNMVGYVGMAQSKPISDWLIASQGWEQSPFWVFMFAACFVATGTAIFKPPAHGTIAAATTEETSSMAWGVFYWVVNIGGALAPMGAAVLRAEIDWHIVFYAAAIVTALNFLPAFLIYREPKREAPKTGEDQPSGVFGVFAHSILTIFKDLRLVVFLGIFSCFWLMFMQLWDLLPNFIDEWVDSSDVAGIFAKISGDWVLGSGQVKPEMIINIDAIAIILFVIPLSWLIGKLNKVVAMVLGMLISLVAFVLSGSTMVGLICCLAVFIFSIGEMACSPTFSAYVGLIAPKDKKALYMGYSNIPFAIGWALGGLIGGFIYEDYGSRANLALKELSERPQLIAQCMKAADWSDSLHRLPPLLGIDRDEAFEVATGEMGVSSEVAAETLRTAFHADQGQNDNLACVFLALQEDNKDKVVAGLAGAVGDVCSQVTKDAGYYSAEVNASLKAQAAEPPADAPAELLSAASSLAGSSRIANLVRETRRVAQGEATLQEIGVARWVDLIPGCLNVKPEDVWTKVREVVNKDVPREEWRTDSEIARMLWERFGEDPAVLDNLALEYLAQATDRLSNAVAAMQFQADPEDMKARTAEIEDRTGITGDKAFIALSAAVGRSDAEVTDIIKGADIAAESESDRIALYLIQNPEHRFDAFRKADWKNNTDVLRQIVRDDPKALEVVLAEIDDVGIFEGIINGVRSIVAEKPYEGVVTDEGVNYHKLAQKTPLIRKAMDVRDWSDSPELATAVLGLNNFEARALIAADTKAATKLLWDKYDPYMVWYYLGGIGLLGTIGMIIFYFATKKPVGETA